MKVNKTFSSLLILIYVIINYSCNVDNLELINPNELTPETYFKTESQVQSAVNAAYANLQTRGLYQRTIFFAMDNMALEQVMNPSSEADKVQYTNYSFDANHIAIGAYWASCYLGINKANYVINNEDKINEIPDGICSQTRKDKFIGEAKFLRAFYYFLLVTRFGDIPLIIEIPENNEGIHKSPRSQVWSQIEADLTDAAMNCLSKEDEELGRATSGAAWALLGKAHLFQANASKDIADYNAAKEAFLNVLNKPVYYLEDRYLNNFEEETEHGPESLFEVEFNATLGYNNIWDSDRSGAGYNEITFRAKEYGLMDWFNVYPVDDLLDEFESGDPRYGYCFYSLGDIYNNGNDTVDYIPIERRAGWRKYQNYYKQEHEDMESGINMKVIRLADVMLMMAEVENELSNTEEAINYLNRIRNRTDVMMPEYGTPAMNSIYPVTNLAEIQRAIEHERKVELCGEQVRFNDLVRWRRLEDFIDEVYPSLPIHVQYSFKFDPDIHYLWPIPQAEIDLNKALTQADQNPGY